jgi:hypothetical protein
MAIRSFVRRTDCLRPFTDDVISWSFPLVWCGFLKLLRGIVLGCILAGRKGFIFGE